MQPAKERCKAERIVASSMNPLVDEAHLNRLRRALEQYQHWQPYPATPTTSPLDLTLVGDLVFSLQLALSLHSSLSHLSARYTKQSQLLERVQADNQRLQRENDVCVDQLFLHAVPVSTAFSRAKLSTRTSRKEKRSRQQSASEQASFVSGFESTDEEEEEEAATDSDEDSTSQTSSSGSKCPSRTDMHEDCSDVDVPSHAPTASPSAPPFDALVRSLVNHASSQQVHDRLTHLSTLLTLQAFQPLSAPPASPTSVPSSNDTLNGTGSSDASSAFERSAELGGIPSMREQMQRERSRRSRRIAAQLRQLVQQQSAEMAAMRAELDVLRSAAYDSHAGAAARDTLQLHEWLETATERSSSGDRGRRLNSVTVGSAVRLDTALPLGELVDTPRLYQLLDSVMRHVQHSGVQSQSLVEDVKRLYAHHGESAGAEES